MARIYLTFYQRIAAEDGNNAVMAPQEPALGFDVLDIGVDEVVSKPFPERARFVEIKTEADCHIVFSVMVDGNWQLEKATPDRGFIDGGERLTKGVYPGQQLAVIGVV